jgi:hypothetical protein
MATTRTITKVNRELLQRIRQHAFQELSPSRRDKTNLHLDERVHEPGEYIGPPRQGIVAERPSILVFADDDPQANFGHPCRYLLYEAQNGHLYDEKAAEFPPFVKGPPKTLRPFHEPVKFIEATGFPLYRWPRFRCPVIVPKGRRYAILYSGMSNKRHLNDIEFLYRTLIDLYHFNPADIYALSYDGTLNTQDGVQVHWPGDGTNYRINLTGSGTQADLEAAIDDLKTKIKKDDLLLIHTNNHGGYDGTPGTANLCTYPSWDGYYANDFANKVGELPEFNKLIVMMEQCHAGGFNAPILAHSPAHATSVASAAIEPNNSYVTADGNWDPFARDWIAAQAGHTALGAPLSFNPDTDGNGKIEAEEAFAYADAVKDTRDTPDFSESSEAGGDISLRQEFTIWWWWWWCEIIHRIFYPIYVKLPPEEYERFVRGLQPELEKMVTSLNERASELRDEYTQQLERTVTAYNRKEKK